MNREAGLPGLIHFDGDDTRRGARHDADELRREPEFARLGQRPAAALVLTHGTQEQNLVAEPAGVRGKIERRATQPLPIREDVIEDFTNADDPHSYRLDQTPSGRVELHGFKSHRLSYADAGRKAKQEILGTIVGGQDASTEILDTSTRERP